MFMCNYVQYKTNKILFLTNKYRVSRYHYEGCAVKMLCIVTNENFVCSATSNMNSFEFQPCFYNYMLHFVTQQLVFIDLYKFTKNQIQVVHTIPTQSSEEQKRGIIKNPSTSAQYRLQNPPSIIKHQKGLKSTLHLPKLEYPCFSLTRKY